MLGLHTEVLYHFWRKKAGDAGEEAVLRAVPGSQEKDHEQHTPLPSNRPTKFLVGGVSFFPFIGYNGGEDTGGSTRC